MVLGRQVGSKLKNLLERKVGLFWKGNCLPSCLRGKVEKI